MKTCHQCGAPLGEGALFCAACGAAVPAEEKKSRFCHKCGAKLGENAAFCHKCGTAAPAEKAPAPEPVAEPAAEPVKTDEDWADMFAAVESQVAKQDVPQQDAPAPAEKKPAEKKKFPVLAVCLAAAGVLILVVGLLLGLRVYKRVQELKAGLSSGTAYMESGDYASAEEAYESALENNSGNVEVSIGLAEALLRQGRLGEAMSLLQDLEIEEKDEFYGTYLNLLAAAQMDPYISYVNLDDFPIVQLTLACGTIGPEMGDLTVLENGSPCGIVESSVDYDRNEIHIVYQTYEPSYGEENRDITVKLDCGAYELSCSRSYLTPVFQEADLRLVSTDVSQYPLVRAYYRVEDLYSGDTISGLDSENFTIWERCEGGEYLAREIRSVEPLKNNQGLNIGLVADKSDSISNSDMQKIKQVMTEFVGKLHYDVGDRAEVLAFDTIVQQMCNYTGDPDRLIHGIQNMSTDGATAFYDAVYSGINHAALQGGARCVIAFTDGQDNRSRYDVDDVIYYANTQQVPVYIIGVGYGVEDVILTHLAESTGGRYWYIDDLYDLSVIFEEIYREQKDLYAVEYYSDAGLDAYLGREVSIQLSGQGYRGQSEVYFEPVYSLPEDQRDKNSRYEVFREALTWEEAAQRCEEMGGHLATIDSQAEMDMLVGLAESKGVKYVWLGGYTSYDDVGNVFGHWITGEPFVFEKWSESEPSRVDRDGTPEWYIMLWTVPALDGWYWNDQRNDVVGAVPSMAKEMGFICEFDI